MSPFPSPLHSTNSFAKSDSFDVTPTTGTEFAASTQLSSILADPTKIKDLAILVSQRGVVFFRGQDIQIDGLIELAKILGRESGSPPESGLHVHPITEEGSEKGDVVRKIVPDFRKIDTYSLEKRRASRLWHSDISFEPIPSSYAILKLNSIPKTGGDTIWANAYEAYDRLSPAMQHFLSGLTATHVGDSFFPFLATGKTFRSPRGHPENAGQGLSSSHPVIRTNPVTGWKGLYVNRDFTKRINELSVDESDHLLSFLWDHIAQNHDLQVRFKWQPDSIAIWDNRSTLHNITQDYGFFPRDGDRVISLGEKPYYDPASKSRSGQLKRR